jgi:hypothetical protein
MRALQVVLAIAGAAVVFAVIQWGLGSLYIVLAALKVQP